jgi:hypothetical protein
MPSRLAGSHAIDALYGNPVHLGTVIATTTKNNTDTAVPFNSTGDALKGKMLLLQSDAAFYVRAGTVSTITVTTGTSTTAGVKVEAGEKYILSMGREQGWIACVSASGTATVQVFEMA